MIGDWLGEDDQSTYYEAKIIEQFTGDKISEIILNQGGNSNCTYNNYPLFISGNELLVFLKEYTCQETYNTYYRITGGPQTVLHAVIDKNGNAYYLYCSSISLLDPEGVIETLPHDSFTYELYQKLILEDPELSEMPYEYIHFYSREDFLTLLP